MYQWTRDAKVLVGGILGLTVGAATLLVWLGSVMLRQERTRQLEHAADRAVQVLERQLGAAEAGLAALVATPEASPDDGHPASSGADSGLTVLFTPDAIQAFPSSGLLFYPNLPIRPEPGPDLFADGEAVEYRNPGQAVTVYRRLAASPDQGVRAAALLRLARVLRQSDDLDAALDAYDDMAALSDVPVIGLPADLIARAARMDLLGELDRPDDATREAQALLDDLANGHWTLTRGQYELYVEQAAHIADAPGTPAERIALAQGVSDLWEQWQRGSAEAGRRVIRTGGVHLLAVSHGTRERMGAWLIEPEALATQLTAELGIAVTLSDASGIVAGTSIAAGQRAVRIPADTRLPWTVHVNDVLPASSADQLTQRRLIITGLGVMLTFLVAGSYVIGRAVKREMDLSRQQADFVSAVSHEFRTPLAAMRQLSELLAAGRVTRAERQQQYFESLAGESRRLQRLVENLLDFGRLEAGARPFRIEPIDPRALVEQVVAEFRAEPEAARPRIDVDGDEDTGHLMGDQDALSLALHNLIDNALKYSGNDKPVRVHWNRMDGRVALSVRDGGPGLAAEERDRIFARFVRGSAAASGGARGSGIGLAIVQQVVAGLGGEVRVDSEPGAGATFTLLLPAVETP